MDSSSSSDSLRSFHAASSWLSSAPAAANLPNETKLELYGLFKVVTTSGAPTGPRPSIFYPTPRAKFDAWTAQSSKYGGRGEDAGQRYVDIAKSVGWRGEGLEPEEDDPDFEADEDGKGEGSTSTGGMGPRVSVMAPPTEEAEDGSGHPLHDAVVDNALPNVETILKRDPHAINVKDRYGNTPLHLATDRGHAEIVAALLQAGADKNVEDEDGQTPLQIAEALEREELIKLLR